MTQNLTDNIRNDFIKYLDSLGISHKSHKNYRSDLGHFLSWAILKFRGMGSYIETLSELIPFLGSHIAAEYKKFMIDGKNPDATINRRLSTLRHLSKFLVIAGHTQDDFMKGLENITHEVVRTVSKSNLLSDFEHHLEAKKVSKSTIKNYVSDIRQFLTWMDNFNKQSLSN